MLGINQKKVDVLASRISDNTLVPDNLTGEEEAKEIILGAIKALRYSDTLSSEGVKLTVADLEDLGWERVTDMNPPLHGVVVGWRNRFTILSDHGDYLLFHCYGGNRTIRTKRQLERVTTFLSESWEDKE